MSKESGAEQCCADCGMPISADEAYVCDDCSAFYAIFRDPNGDMTGEDDEPTRT